MKCPQMSGQHKDHKNDPSFNHGCKTCDMMEECMEHKENMLMKAESELRAIRNRIEAVTEDEILEIIEEQDEKYIYFITADKYIAKAIIEKIKQIGGVK